MSYDVTIGPKDFNYTYNMSRLFYDHIDEGIRSLDGKTGKTAAVIISEALERIHATYVQKWDFERGVDVFREHYDAPNKWGSTDGALLFLARIMAACIAHPRSIVRVS